MSNNGDSQKLGASLSMERSSSEEFVASYSVDSNPMQRLPPDAAAQQQQQQQQQQDQQVQPPRATTSPDGLSADNHISSNNDNSSSAGAANAGDGNAGASGSSLLPAAGGSGNLDGGKSAPRRMRSHSGYGKSMPARPGFAEGTEPGSPDGRKLKLLAHHVDGEQANAGNAVAPSGLHGPVGGGGAAGGAGSDDASSPDRSQRDDASPDLIKNTSARDLQWSFTAGGGGGDKTAGQLAQAGVCSEQGQRRTMEDQHTMMIGQVGGVPIPFFAVYDGHAGTAAAEFLRDKLHELIFKQPNVLTDPEAAVIAGCADAERDFMEKCKVERLEAGSTVALAMIVGKRLVVGNIGDSEIVLSRAGDAVLLTTKHHLASNPSEVERVKAAGGRIHGNRVGHPKFNPSLMNIAVSRAIGDAGFKLDEYTDGKASGLIATAETMSLELTADDEFLVIGCDGLWDVMTYADAVNICRGCLVKGASSQEITELLVQEAFNRASSDNVTVMFVNLRERGATPIQRRSPSGMAAAAESGQQRMERSEILLSGDDAAAAAAAASSGAGGGVSEAAQNVAGWDYVAPTALNPAGAGDNSNNDNTKQADGTGDAGAKSG